MPIPAFDRGCKDMYSSKVGKFMYLRSLRTLKARKKVEINGRRTARIIQMNPYPNFLAAQ
jgi:hypothetical protein